MSKSKNNAEYIRAGDILNEHVAYLCVHQKGKAESFAGGKEDMVNLFAERKDWLEAGVSPEVLVKLSGDILRTCISKGRLEKVKRIAECIVTAIHKELDEQEQSLEEQLRALRIKRDDTRVQTFRIRNRDGFMKVI